MTAISTPAQSHFPLPIARHTTRPPPPRPHCCRDLNQELLKDEEGLTAQRGLVSGASNPKLADNQVGGGERRRKGGGRTGCRHPCHAVAHHKSAVRARPHAARFTLCVQNGT